MVHHQLKFLKQVVVNWSHFKTMSEKHLKQSKNYLIGKIMKNQHYLF